MRDKSWNRLWHLYKIGQLTMTGLILYILQQSEEQIKESLREMPDSVRKELKKTVFGYSPGMIVINGPYPPVHMVNHLKSKL